MERYDRWARWARSIRRDDHATSGGQKSPRPCAPAVAGGDAGSCRQPTNMVVTQRVEDALDQHTGGGDLGLVAAAAFGDLVAEGTQPGVRSDPLYRLDRRPPHQLVALFGDPPAVHPGVGLVVAGGQPRPAGQLLGPVEPVNGPISATNTAPRVGPTPGMVCTAAYPG